MSERIPVGVLGATGMVGQEFVSFLRDHPWFELTWLAASDRSAGKPYREATTWRLGGETPAYARDIVVSDAAPKGAPKLVFSSMDASVATEIEQAFAKAGHVIVSNSRNHRMDADVPLLALAPLKQFGIQKVIVTTMQAVSGAGYPGVASLDILGNVVPFIGGEEPKMESETQKILGTFAGGKIEPLAAKVSAACNRVAVVNGHTICVSVEFEKKPSEAEMIAALNGFRAAPQQMNLPSAPAQPVIYMEQTDRPQPRRDVERENGMAVFVGRLRKCPVLDYKFVAMGHNTVRGAAGAAVLNAELMKAQGLLG